MHKLLPGALALSLLLAAGCVPTGLSIPGTGNAATTVAPAGSVVADSKQGGDRTLTIRIGGASDGTYTSQALVHRWVAADVFEFDVVLTLNGQPVVTVPVRANQGQATAVLTHLKAGVAYSVAVIARGNVGGTAGTQVLNAMTPATGAIQFTGSNDVENSKSVSIMVKLDDVAFDGTATVSINVIDGGYLSASESFAIPTLQVASVSPTIVSADTVFYIKGQGFDANVQVKLGETLMTIVDVTPTLITAKVPANFQGGPQALPVVITRGNVSLTATESVTVKDTSTFGGTVTVPGAGLMAQVHRIPYNTQALPTDLASRTPDSTFLLANIDVSGRSFTAGFPGVSGNVYEWFALRIAGQLNVASSGNTEFRLYSDDGSKLYIDNQLVVNNDLIHAMASATGSVNLSPGPHQLVVDYFQGPASGLGLQLFWTPPGQPETIVPTNVLTYTP